MSDTGYQGIQYINTSSNNYKDNQIDTSGKVDEKIIEKITENKYTYYVDGFDNPTNNSNKTIKFNYNNNTYTLYEITSEGPKQFDPPIGTTVYNTSNNIIYLLSSINNNTQTWAQNSFFDPKQTITLLGSPSLMVDNTANFNGNININNDKIQYINSSNDLKINSVNTKFITKLNDIETEIGNLNNNSTTLKLSVINNTNITDKNLLLMSGEGFDLDTKNKGIKINNDGLEIKGDTTFDNNKR